jgi:hypothetical protein
MKARIVRDGVRRLCTLEERAKIDVVPDATGEKRVTIGACGVGQCRRTKESAGGDDAARAAEPTQIPNVVNTLEIESACHVLRCWFDLDTRR